MLSYAGILQEFNPRRTLVAGGVDDNIVVLFSLDARHTVLALDPESRAPVIDGNRFFCREEEARLFPGILYLHGRDEGVWLDVDQGLSCVLFASCPVRDPFIQPLVVNDFVELT